MLQRRQVVINMLPVFQAERFSAGEDRGQVRIAVAVTVGHAAAVERHCGIEQRPLCVPHFAQTVEEIAELGDGEQAAEKNDVLASFKSSYNQATLKELLEAIKQQP